MAAGYLQALAGDRIEVRSAGTQPKNEVNPSAYPPKVVAPCKTREQVRAELAEARRTGNMMANDESGCLLNEINPSAYPPKPVVPCKTREQVRAELDEAKRTGKNRTCTG